MTLGQPPQRVNIGKTVKKKGKLPSRNHSDNGGGISPGISVVERGYCANTT